LPVNDAVEGPVRTAGTELATAYNFNEIYVTAGVDETSIKVPCRALVDIDVDRIRAAPYRHRRGHPGQRGD